MRKEIVDKSTTFFVKASVDDIRVRNGKIFVKITVNSGYKWIDFHDTLNAMKKIEGREPDGDD